MSRKQNTASSSDSPPHAAEPEATAADGLIESGQENASGPAAPQEPKRLHPSQQRRLLSRKVDRLELGLATLQKEVAQVKREKRELFSQIVKYREKVGPAIAHLLDLKTDGHRGWYSEPGLQRRTTKWTQWKP